MNTFEQAKQFFIDGLIFLEAGDFLKAEYNFIQSLDRIPNRASTLTNLSVAQFKQKKYSEAKTSAEMALLVDRNNIEAYINLGLIEVKLNSLESALFHFNKALSLNSDYAEAYSNKGNVLNDLKRYEEAIVNYDKALSLKPDYHEVWANKGNVLNDLKRYEEAIVNYDKALSLKPDIDWIRGYLIHAKMKICSWGNIQDDFQKVVAALSHFKKVIPPFALLSLTDNSSLHKRASEIYAQEKHPVNTVLGSIIKRPKKEKIRIGYFSADFKKHPVAFLTAELFELHDRDRFEIYAFSLEKAPSDDEMRCRLINAFDHFIDADILGDVEVAVLARDLEIDIAIDLSGFTQGSRPDIFAYRAAPIQVNWLGYPGTLGSDYMDYIIADKTVIPKEELEFYVEKVAYLHNSYIVDDSTRIASTKLFTRREFGLPEEGFIFCCFNNDYKFNQDILDVWSNILHRVGDSVLWISENNEIFKKNITAAFNQRGILSGRIIFAKRLQLMEDHLKRLSLADLFLDTYPYNAHTTAVDALKAKLPILTLMGKSFPSRVAASLLNAVDLPCLITDSKEGYEAAAIELANNSEKLANIKDRLTASEHKSTLFNTTLFAQDIEGIYMQMYESYHAGLQPGHIFIK